MEYHQGLNRLTSQDCILLENLHRFLSAKIQGPFASVIFTMLIKLTKETLRPVGCHLKVMPTCAEHSAFDFMFVK